MCYPGRARPWANAYQGSTVWRRGGSPGSIGRRPNDCGQDNDYSNPREPARAGALDGDELESLRQRLHAGLQARCPAQNGPQAQGPTDPPLKHGSRTTIKRPALNRGACDRVPRGHLEPGGESSKRHNQWRAIRHGLASSRSTRRDPRAPTGSDRRTPRRDGCACGVTATEPPAYGAVTAPTRPKTGRPGHRQPPRQTRVRALESSGGAPAERRRRWTRVDRTWRNGRHDLGPYPVAQRKRGGRGLERRPRGAETAKRPYKLSLADRGDDAAGCRSPGPTKRRRRWGSRRLSPAGPRSGPVHGPDAGSTPLPPKILGAAQENGVTLTRDHRRLEGNPGRQTYLTGLPRWQGGTRGGAGIVKPPFRGVARPPGTYRLFSGRQGGAAGAFPPIDINAQQTRDAGCSGLIGRHRDPVSEGSRTGPTQRVAPRLLGRRTRSARRSSRAAAARGSPGGRELKLPGYQWQRDRPERAFSCCIRGARPGRGV